MRHDPHRVFAEFADVAIKEERKLLPFVEQHAEQIGVRLESLPTIYTDGIHRNRLPFPDTIEPLPSIRDFDYDPVRDGDES